MNPIAPYAARPAIGKWLNVTSRTLFRGQTCEEVDCCCKTIKAPLKLDEPVVEKDVEPCYFSTWKPTVPKLEPQPEKKVCVLKPKGKRVCYAGMPTPKCNSEVKGEAKECFEIANPKNVPHAKIQSCSIAELAQLKAYEKTKKGGKSKTGKVAHSRPKKVKLPEPDWDHDCIV